MDKIEFIEGLRSRLHGLPKEELEERLGFYSEMIDDRIEEGFSEVEAVNDIGNIDEIASQIIGDIPLIKIAKERIKPKRRLKVWEIVLLAAGSPLWLILAVSVIVVVLSVYVSLWTAIISLWAIFASVAACAPSSMLAGFAPLGSGATVSLPLTCSLGSCSSSNLGRVSQAFQ